MTINTVPHVHNLIMCANVFVRRGGQYLMIRRSSEKTFLPGLVNPIGGKIDADEDPYRAAQRELFEEAGVRVKNMRLEAVMLEINPVPDSDENWLIFQFSADYDSGEITKTEEGELVWLDAKDIPQQKLFSSLAKIIHHILDPNDGTVFTSFAYGLDGEIIAGSGTIDVCAVS